jgi:hypothetical protein
VAPVIILIIIFFARHYPEIVPAAQDGSGPGASE